MRYNHLKWLLALCLLTAGLVLTVENVIAPRGISQPRNASITEIAPTRPNTRHVDSVESKLSVATIQKRVSIPQGTKEQSAVAPPSPIVETSGAVTNTATISHTIQITSPIRSVADAATAPASKTLVGSVISPSVVVSATVGAEPQPTMTVSLPVVMGRSRPLGWRFGVGVLGGIDDYDVAQLGYVGWYQSWQVRERPLRPLDMEFVQLIKVRDDADPRYDQWPPDWAEIDAAIAANPGALWFIGNEPDVISQDNCTPSEYAECYHACYQHIKSRDPTACLSAAGIVQPTPLRLEWLDRALAEYETRYGTQMPVDVWNIHMQLLREVRDEWGCQIPPGLDDERGEDRQIADNASVLLFEEKVVAFRQWMADNGQSDKELIISEYGVLYPSGLGYLGLDDPDLGDQMVKDFMVGTFDYCLTARDEQLGCPSDGFKLVQRWAWYSLNDRPWDMESGYFDGFNGSLFEWQRDYPGTLTTFGRQYRDYVLSLDEQYLGGGNQGHGPAENR